MIFDQGCSIRSEVGEKGKAVQRTAFSEHFHLFKKGETGFSTGFASSLGSISPGI